MRFSNSSCGKSPAAVRRGAAATESVLLVLAVAIALLVAAGRFGDSTRARVVHAGERLAGAPALPPQEAKDSGRNGLEDGPASRGPVGSSRIETPSAPPAPGNEPSLAGLDLAGAWPEPVEPARGDLARSIEAVEDEKAPFDFAFNLPLGLRDLLDQDPAAKGRLFDLLRAHPALLETLEGFERANDAFDFALNLGKAIAAFDDGRGYDGTLALLRLGRGAIDLLPSSVRDALEKRLPLAKYGTGLIDLLEAGPEVADLARDFHDPAARLRNMPRVAEKAGPAVLGLLVQGATGSEALGQAAKFLAEKGTEQLAELGRQAVAAQVGALMAKEHALRSLDHYRTAMNATARLAGLDSVEASRFAGLMTDIAGPHEQRYLLDRLYAGDAESVRSAFAEHDRVGALIDTVHSETRAGADRTFRNVAQVMDEDDQAVRDHLSWYNPARAFLWNTSPLSEEERERLRHGVGFKREVLERQARRAPAGSAERALLEAWERDQALMVEMTR